MGKALANSRESAPRTPFLAKVVCPSTFTVGKAGNDIVVKAGVVRNDQFLSEEERLDYLEDLARSPKDQSQTDYVAVTLLLLFTVVGTCIMVGTTVLWWHGCLFR